MPKPPLDPPLADQAPTAGDLTDYDREHLVTYMRLLDADAEGAECELERARRAWESNLARAKWMIEHEYRDLVWGSTRH